MATDRLICPFLSAVKLTECIGADCVFGSERQEWEYVGFDENNRSKTTYSSGRRPTGEVSFGGCSLSSSWRPQAYPGAG